MKGSHRLRISCVLGRLAMLVVLGGMFAIGGCAKDAVTIKVDGMYRNAFKGHDGRWYYVKDGRKVYLNHEPVEASNYNDIRNEHQEFLH